MTTIPPMYADSVQSLLSGPLVVAMAAPQDGASPLMGLLPAVLILVIFYFVLLLPMRRRQKKVQQFLDALKVGDKVVTSGGILATITRIGDSSLQVQVAERVRIEISRNAVVGYQGQDPVVPNQGGA
ncbi:MAG: preprotein translocase subunit YajC [Acidimicrobiia bacterium]|nr:preprotein translocase subunit YajC [Acidimicrobiia bacterium]